MKLSFATLGCPKWTLEQIAANAKAMGFDGVELRGVDRRAHRPGGDACGARAHPQALRFERHPDRRHHGLQQLHDGRSGQAQGEHPARAMLPGDREGHRLPDAAAVRRRVLQAARREGQHGARGGRREARGRGMPRRPASTSRWRRTTTGRTGPTEGPHRLRRARRGSAPAGTRPTATSRKRRRSPAPPSAIASCTSTSRTPPWWTGRSRASCPAPANWT